MNTDEQQELAGAFNIRSIPTLMVFREKVILFQQAGALPGQALEQHYRRRGARHGQGPRRDRRAETEAAAVTLGPR